KGRANSYAVGYGRPPEHSRFQPGQSGNPAGRPRGVRNIRTDVQRTLVMPIMVKEGARPRKVSTQEAVLLVLREQALKGDARARERLLALAERYSSTVAEPSTQALPAADAEILAAYVARAAAPAAASSQKEEVLRPRVKPRPMHNRLKIVK